MIHFCCVELKGIGKGAVWGSRCWSRDSEVVWDVIKCCEVEWTLNWINWYKNCTIRVCLLTQRTWENQCKHHQPVLRSGIRQPVRNNWCPMCGASEERRKLQLQTSFKYVSLRLCLPQWLLKWDTCWITVAAEVLQWHCLWLLEIVEPVFTTDYSPHTLDWVKRTTGSPGHRITVLKVLSEFVV